MGTFVDKPDAPVVVTDANINDAIAKYPFLIVDCWANWCGPCKMMGPVLDKLAKDHQGDIVFAKLDVDSNPETSGKYGIRSIPDLLVFKNGEKVGDIVGAMPEQLLMDKIKAYR